MIRENIRKGFLDTQTKVSSWFQTVKKRLDGEEEEGGQSSQTYGNEGYNRPRRSGDLGRRSGDRERYDADPQVLSDDFSALELRDSEGLIVSSPERILLHSANIGSSSACATSQTSRELQPLQVPLTFPRQAQGVLPRRPAHRNW